MKIDCAFPGGNIVLVDIEGDEVILSPDLRDTRGHWFWWYFRVTGAPTREVHFVFTTPGMIGTSGVAISHDGGRTWGWHQDVAREGGWVPDSFTYRAPDGEQNDVEGVRFAFAVPYLKETWDAFLESRGTAPCVQERVLCSSRKERPVHYYLLGTPEKTLERRVLLVARHHACESPPNFVLEGIIEHVMSSDWFHEHVQVLIVPFMDIDGVEEGDQGKNREPWDHNRDYGVECLYPEVKAVKDLVPHWAGTRLDIAIDLHAPGRTDDFFHMVGQDDPAQWAEVSRFSRVLAAACDRAGCALVMDPGKNVPWGTGWNNRGTTGVERTHSSWIGSLGIARLCTTLEVPYGSVLGVPVTPERLREFGRVLGGAFKTYLKE